MAKFKKKWKLFGIVVPVMVAAMGTLAYSNAVLADESDEDAICEGICLDSVDVGGMTQAEAKTAYENYLNDLKGTTVQFYLEDKTCEISMQDLNIEAEVKDAVEEAYAYGRSGNLLKRYREITDIAKDTKEIDVELSFNEDYLVETLDAELADYIVPATNAGLEFSDGELTLVEAKNGKELNSEDTIDKLIEAIGNWSGNGELKVEVATNELAPEHTSEELAEVTDVIGTFETRYTLGDVSRNNNIANAANKINGTVVYPGDEFDTMSFLLPFTTDNGWSYAGAYLNGEVISDIGGGICQVSTTLYNAVLDAELEVSERHPHSMAVGYVQLSADAALNEGTKNFKFINNTDAPIFVYAYASNGTIHVSIYGKEWRDENRTVEYKNEIISVVPAGDPIETVDEALPPDYREVTQTAHTGYRTKLWKYVYENGELVDTILVNSSSYSASPERVTIGKPADPVPPADPNASTEAPADPNAPSTEMPTTPTEPSTEPTTPPAPETPAAPITP